MDVLYKNWFSALSGVQQKKTSDYDARYNCIAWAFGDSKNHWWPNRRRSHWPLDATGKTDLEAFEEWFAKDGWTETTDYTVEPGVVKIALYLQGGKPTHAARLMPNGLWTSKLGSDIDLSHSQTELDGPLYGTIYKLYCKRP